MLNCAKKCSIKKPINKISKLKITKKIRKKFKTMIKRNQSKALKKRRGVLKKDLKKRNLFKMMNNLQNINLKAKDYKKSLKRVSN